MTLGGWITMVASLALVWGLMAWCFAKVLRSPNPEGEKAPPGFGP